MGRNDWEWDYRTSDGREPQGPPLEDPAEKVAREKLGVGKSEWRVLQGRSVNITDLKEAREKDARRAAGRKR